MLVAQNSHIKKFAVLNNINDHIKIYAIRPLKNNESLFEAFANVSSVLREGFHHNKDKVTLGLTTCKVYDRYTVSNVVTIAKTLAIIRKIAQQKRAQLWKM